MSLAVLLSVAAIVLHWHLQRQRHQREAAEEKEFRKTRSWFEERGKYMVEIQLQVKEWPKKYPDRISFEDDLEHNLYENESSDTSTWLKWIGSGSGLGVVDITYETTDPARFLVVARLALQRLQMPPSTKILISDAEGSWSSHSVYESL